MFLLRSNHFLCGRLTHRFGESLTSQTVSCRQQSIVYCLTSHFFISFLFSIPFYSFSLFYWIQFLSRKCYRFTSIRFVWFVNEVDGVCFGLFFHYSAVFRWFGRIGVISIQTHNATLLFVRIQYAEWRTNRYIIIWILFDWNFYSN